MNHYLGSGLRKLISSGMSLIRLSDNFLSSFGWDNSSARLLKFALFEKIIEEQKLLADIHLRLKELGRISFNQHKQGQHLDNTYSPHALAYAIQNGEFTLKERSMIQYDHGQTELDFIRSYNSKDLKQEVLYQLLNEKEVISATTEDPEFWCSH